MWLSVIICSQERIFFAFLSPAEPCHCSFSLLIKTERRWSGFNSAALIASTSLASLQPGLFALLVVSARFLNPIRHPLRPRRAQLRVAQVAGQPYRSFSLSSAWTHIFTHSLTLANDMGEKRRQSRNLRVSVSDKQAERHAHVCANPIWLSPVLIIINSAGSKGVESASGTRTAKGFLTSWEVRQNSHPDWVLLPFCPRCMSVASMVCLPSSFVYWSDVEGTKLD